MTNQKVDTSQKNAAKFAGLAYILIIVLAMFKVNFLETGLIIPGNDALTVSNIKADELLFRIGIVIDLTMYVFVVLLSLALYITLRPVNINLAKAAMLMRFTEGILGGVVTLISGFIPLLLLKGDSFSTGFAAEQLQALIGLFLDVRIAGLDVVLMFIGFGGTLFCYLFFISRYVPAILASWGIFTYLSMLILSFTSILFPNHPETIELVLYSIGGLFEIIFGFWLLFKGVKVREIKSTYQLD